MRNLTPEMIADFTAGVVYPAFLIDMFFDSGTLRLWTGYGTLSWGGNNYTGGGNLIGISAVEETQELQAKGMAVTLNGISSSIISLALAEKMRGRPFRLYLASVNTTGYVELEDDTGRIELEDGTGYMALENSIFINPYRLFSGLMDYAEFSDNGETADIRLTVENILITGQRANNYRYTAEEQKRRFADDAGLDFINQLQDKEIVW